MKLSGKRIFMVEDNQMNKAIQSMLMEQNGAKIRIGRWDKNTINTLQRFMPVDLIVLDLMYPAGISGFDIFKEIRQYEDFDDVPIIAVSASNPSEAIAKAKELGFSGYISKPIDFDKFADQVAEIIDGNELWISS